MALRGKIRRVFPGGNTYKGFHSFYDYIIESEKANRIFCMKGGPGVGKSSFMKSIATEFLDSGCDVEFHHCSSDPDSLDAVVIKQAKVAILDGTAPHVVDPKNPGAVDEILNFGVFWDSKGFDGLRNKILEINREKKCCYESGYQYLKSAKALQDDIEINAAYALDSAKWHQLVLSLRDEFAGIAAKTGGLGKERHLFHAALTSEGRVSFAETLIDDGMRRFLLDGVDSKAKSDLLLLLAREFVFKGNDVEIFHQPLNPERVEMVIVLNLNLAFTSDTAFSERAEKIISLDKAFMPEKLEQRREMIEKDKGMMEQLLNEAYSRFKAAKLKHGELEKLYIPLMDFGAVDEFRIRIADRIRKFL